MRVVDPQPTALFGRESETKALADRIDAAKSERGGALVVRGAPGVGKSTLLGVARAYGVAAGFEILATTGVQSETHLPFAGLHQLLRPVLRDIDRLPGSYRDALRSVFGMSDETVASPFLIAMSVLQLLEESTERAPLLLLVDDAHWLDRSTSDALAFVARRLEADPILTIASLRDGFENPFLQAGIPDLTVGALGNADAEALLDARSPKLDAALRERVLRNAAGNPLALVELSIALRSPVEMDRVLGGSDHPLTTRLERAFADRLSSLSSETRCFLHVAAVDDRGQLAELLRAASTLKGREITLEAASEAKEAGLVEIDGLELRFRHPLMRSAIQQAMNLQERHAAHGALAATVEGDRRVWHRAAATVGYDRQVVADLDGIALRALPRGALGISIQALERAAQLAAEHPELRAIMLTRAASLAWVLGRSSDVLRFLDTMDDRQVPELERPFVAFMREEFGRGAWSGASRLTEFIEIAERSRVKGDTNRGLDALSMIAHRCWWSNPDEETRKALVSALERFPVPQDHPHVIGTLAKASPLEHGTIVLDYLSRHAAEPITDFRGAHQLGAAAQAVGDFVQAERYHEAYVRFLRAQGLLGALVGSLVALAWTRIHRGDWRSAGSMASEAERLAEETGQHRWAGTAKLASATIAAYRGEIDFAERLATAGESALVPREANPQLSMVQWPRGAVALAAGRYDEAYQHLRRIFEPSDIAHHPHVRSWVLVDLVEAAVHSGYEGEAAHFVSELEIIAARSRSPLLEGALQFARPVLSPDGDEAAFRPGTGLESWPFTRARLQLAHGVWLRRQRRASDARTPLRLARDAFDSLGAVPWGERARQELRASGETSRRRAYQLVEALSPQELQIAELAAAGLSNKEIGQQLFLSHRTIGSHLYRVFPKLGITARSHLRAALQDSKAPSDST